MKYRIKPSEALLKGPLVRSPITAAAAIVAAAQLTEMIVSYTAALSMPAPNDGTRLRNPLRTITTLTACVTTKPRAIGGGMCEFEALARAGHRYADLHCIAPASIAIHVRSSDVVKVTGINVKHNGANFFDVEHIHGLE